MYKRKFTSVEWCNYRIISLLNRTMCVEQMSLERASLDTPYILTKKMLLKVILNYDTATIHQPPKNYLF